jgi:hypothetical protein
VASTNRTSAADPDQLPALPEATAYLDTIELFFRSLPKDIGSRLKHLRASQGNNKPPYFNKCKHSGWLLTVQHPTRVTLEALHEIQIEFGAILSRFDTAFDWPFSSVDEAMKLKKWFSEHALLRYRRNGFMHDVEGTTYWEWQIGRTRDNRERSNRDLVLYATKPSKVTGDRFCCHFELRHYNADGVKRTTYETVKEVVELNPRLMFSKTIRLADLNVEAFKKKLLQKTVRKYRMSNKGRQKSKFQEKYQDNLPARIKGAFDRLTQHRWQRIKDVFGLPRHYPTIDPSYLNLPDTLTA